METNQEALTYEKVWAMFQETREILDKKFRETDKQIKENDRKFQKKLKHTMDTLDRLAIESRQQTMETRELMKETDRQIKETGEQMKETDRQTIETRELMKETDRQMKETDRQMKETDRQMKETDRQMKNLMSKMSEAELRWGKFVESLVEGAVVKLLKVRGIKVVNTAMREKAEYNNRRFEIDIIARNGMDVVAIEVKTTLRPQDVKEFLSELAVFKQAFTLYAEKKIYGAVAYISLTGNADIMAEKAGLFVFKATGESACITNARDFVPKVW